MDRRLVMDAALYKLRNGICWNELPDEEFGRWQTIYNNASRWLKEGIREKAILRLGEYEGTPLTPAYRLPSMKVTINFAPRPDEEAEVDDSPARRSM
ncbi:transposase [Streptomyces sp. DG2A-72]|uniref:transposase n=1 Tax=Streptomyces sp. DG2A-72 TaxID=3051386 RepID=UPI00265C48A1|nr:transposase [Streptomyces sp. DG2A-72]MDO0931717.1 transposase [Streptomyces sp. DG2A-72]